MPTTSIIAVRADNNVYHFTVCHDDDGINVHLHKYFNTLSRAQHLIDMGELSSIDEDDVCVYVENPNNEWEPQSRQCHSLRELIIASTFTKANYLHLFQEGHWVQLPLSS